MDPRKVTVDEYRAYLNGLARDHADPVYGFFGPHSMTWRINREGVVYLGGLRALLMQIAHPKVAQGVADHSNYSTDPFGRLFRTFDAVHTIVYGPAQAAVETALVVHRVHAKIHGRLIEPVAGISDRDYQANDPELLRWVWATLVDSAIAAYYRALPSLSESDWEAYYSESKIFGRLFGVPETMLPENLEAFRTWMNTTVASATLTVTDTSREIAGFLLKGPAILYPLRPSSYILAAGTLPEKFRRQFRLHWSLPMRAAYAVGARVVRTVTPRIPPVLRTVPAARRAHARCAAASGPAGL